MLYSVSFGTMNEKLVIIFALVYAFYRIVDGSEIISDDQKVLERSNPLKCQATFQKVACIYGWYNGMSCKPCAETGKLHEN